jgi:hypothetical protein
MYIQQNNDNPNTSTPSNGILYAGKTSSTSYEYHYILMPEDNLLDQNFIKTSVTQKIAKFHTMYCSEEQYKLIATKISLHALNSRLTKVLKDIYGLQPDTLALQPTSDSSILISFTIDNKKSYIEFFPENSALGIEEFILNMYQGDEDLVDSFSGSSSQLMGKIKSEIKKQNSNTDLFFNNQKPILNVGSISLSLVTST